MVKVVVPLDKVGDGDRVVVRAVDTEFKRVAIVEFGSVVEVVRWMVSRGMGYGE